jgi:hypothetical protein
VLLLPLLRDEAVQFVADLLQVADRLLEDVAENTSSRILA